MKINWFPGHMTKSLRMIQQEIQKIDIVIYVLDSRAPFSSINPELDTIIGNKPVIYVLNKSDLSNPELNTYWQKYFSQKENAKAIIVNSIISGSGKIIINYIKELLENKINKNRKRGIRLPLRAIVIGIPNSGKSTLINNLSNKKKTITGDKPGVTRGKQWVKISDGIELLDTPGTLYPNLNNNTIAKHLAYIGSIKDQVYDVQELTLELLKDMVVIDKKNIEKRYGIEINKDDPITIYNQICDKRGYVLKAGENDYLRAAYSIIDDFRKGKLGKITLDKTE